MSAKAKACPWAAGLTLALAVTIGCNGSFDLDVLEWLGAANTGLSASTVLTSSTLNSAEESAQAADPVDDPDGLQITPDNITGKVLSVLFAIDDTEDEGVLVFGNERPDIAPADSELYDFDLAYPTPIRSTISLKPGFVGGYSSNIVLLFGYMDIEFTLNGRTRVVRVALADVDPMQRGDVLLQRPGTDDEDAGFYWYDRDSGEFVSRRPDNPAAIAEIRDFTDPVRPHMVFYPLNVNLNDPVVLTADRLNQATGMETVIDFQLSRTVVLLDQHTEDLDDETLITSFTLAQVATEYSQTGFQADATVTLTSSGDEADQSGSEPVGGSGGGEVDPQYQDDENSPIGFIPTPASDTPEPPRPTVDGPNP